MDSKTTNSLIDFDNFDPFAPTPQKSGNQEITIVNVSNNVFANDPFLNTFDDDNWQDAMQNLNKDQAPASFGEAFGAFEMSDNFDSDWSQKQVSSTTISLNKNDEQEDASNQKFYEFDNVKLKTERADIEKTNKELKFVGNTALNKQVHSFEKEASQPDNLITDDSEIIQTSNINENEREASSVGQHDRPFEGIICSQEEGIHPIIIEPSFSKITQSSNDNDDNVEFLHDYGKDTVNENLVFVSSLEPTVEFVRDRQTTEVDYRENGKEVLAEMDMDRVNVETTNGDQKCLENVETLAESQNTNFYKILNSENAERTSSGTLEAEYICEISVKNTSFASNKGQNHKTFKTDKDLHIELNSDVLNEAGTKDKQTRSDDFENSDLMEDRPRAKKGLAGLKDYDHMEEFTYSNPSRNEKDSSASSAAEKVSSKIFNYGSALENVCKQCNKRVYEMEKITVDFVIYHKSCFRCATCKRMLSPSTYSATDGQIYCKADFLRNFKMKGSYTFSPEPSLPKSDSDSDARTTTEDETPVVPMKYMKNLFEKNGDHAEEPSRLSAHERTNVPDDPRYDVVISSNVYVYDDELPPPSLAKNMRAMFENKSTSPVGQQSIGSVGKGMKKQDEKVCTRKTDTENELPVVSSEPEEDGSDIPQVGITRSLLERWRDIEETGQPKERSRGREEKRGTGAMQRSQSTTRVEISQRLKVVSDDRPKINGNISKEEGQYIRNTLHGQSFQTSAPATKTFKWQVKEATPLNRPGIVHGDVPKYQPVVGEIISEKTPISEIREEMHVRTNVKEENIENDEIVGDAPVKGSYVTEIREEELPDRAAVKSAMQRFKSMEDPTKEPPVPRKVTRAQTNRLSYHGATPETFQPDAICDNSSEGLHEELPVSGTTKSMLAKFQSN